MNYKSERFLFACTTNDRNSDEAVFRIVDLQ